jgi:PilZ domain-containing protein
MRGTLLQQEKRQAVRKRMDQLLYAELGPNNGSIVVNLSEQGCGFQAIAPIRDKELHCTFAIGAGQEIQGTGRVTWLEKAKKSGGLRFINPSTDLREQIRAWLADPRAIDTSAAPPEAPPAFTTPAESEAKGRGAPAMGGGATA